VPELTPKAGDVLLKTGAIGLFMPGVMRRLGGPYPAPTLLTFEVDVSEIRRYRVLRR